MMSICTCHMPDASSEASTTVGCPVAARQYERGADGAGDGQPADHVTERGPGRYRPALGAWAVKIVLHPAAGPVGAGVVTATAGVRTAGPKAVPRT